MRRLCILLVAAGLANACGTGSEPVPSNELWVAPDIASRRAQFVPQTLTAAVDHLSEGDRQALRHLVEAAEAMNEIYLRQAWAGNPEFAGKVSEISEGYAIVDTPAGSLRARSAKHKGEYQLTVGDDAYVFIRPESLKFVNGTSYDNQIKAKVKQNEFEGSFWQVFFDVEGAPRTIKLSMVNDGGEVDHKVSDQVELGFSADQAVATPAGELADET